MDDADYEKLMQWEWHLLDRGRVQYARRAEPNGGRYVTVLMHRQILGAPETVGVDHINCDGLDNRRANLRLASQIENTRNARKTTLPTSSIYKGVSWNKPWGKWEAKIRIDGKLKHLGGFTTQADAALAYNAAAIEHFGEFAHLNVLQEPAA